MLKRKNKLASIILIAGLSLGVVGCGNSNKENKEASKVGTKVESKVSKNNDEKEENKEVNKKESKLNNSINSSISKPSTNTSSKPSNSTNSSMSKPSTNTQNKPSNSTNNSTSKPNVDNGEVQKPAERTWQYMSSLSQDTFSALNSFRESNGVAPLKYSSSEQSRANKQAEINAKNMNADHGMLQIALVGDLSNAQSFINRWSNSSGHRKSMLRDTNVEGAVSVYKDSQGFYYVVVSFSDNW